jgi:PIN domain nuclease of toxin-antitoxin system
MILLDTCVLLWLAGDPSSISAASAAKLRDSRQRVFVSAITAYEVGQKAARKRITIPMPVSQWFPAMLRHHQFQELPVSGAVAASATMLPPIHNDPFDRLLVATALEHNLTLLTPDPLIRQYPGVQSLW